MSLLRRSGLLSSSVGLTPDGRLINRSSAINSVAPLTIAIVRAHRINGGTTYLECWDPHSGEEFRSVPLLALSGDNSDSMLRPAITGDDGGVRTVDPSENDRVVQAVLVRSGTRRAPFCIGFVRHEAIKTVAKLCPQAAEGDDRLSGEFSTDHTMKNGGATFIVGRDGAVLIETPAQGDGVDGMVRVQLGDESTMRISRLGSAPDGLLLATPTLEYLAELEARVTALQAAIDVLTSTPVVLGDGGAAIKSAVSAAYQPAPVPDAATSSLVSQVISISSDAKDAV